jgi:thiol:disulfide interchange protein
LLANLIVPGLGTLVARRRAGIVQVLVSQLGFALTLVWGIWFAITWAQAGEFPEDTGPYLWLGILGAIMFLIAWSWSLASSAILLKQTRTQQQSHRVE